MAHLEYFIFLINCLVLGIDARLPVTWTHGWDTALASQFIDTGYLRLTDVQAEWVGQHYAMYSIEKCTGYNARLGLFTEQASYETAVQLKRFTPSIKVLFYLHTEMISFNCYAAYSIYIAHPEWWLRDDLGVVMNNTGQSAMIPKIDYTVAAARDFWVSIPLGGTGSPNASVIDGLLADGSGVQNYFCSGSRINATRCAALIAGKNIMIHQMQSLFNTTNGGMVLQNGIDSDPTLSTLPSGNGIMAEHFASFEHVVKNKNGPGTWGYNIPTLTAHMDHITAAAAAGKTVVVACWVGPASVPFTAQGYPSWPLNDQPNTTAGWRAALVSWHVFALAGFLTLAQDNVWMQYQGWYTQHQGAVGCNGSAACAAPEPWYPDLYRPLGKPLGIAVRTNNSWTRHFERATSFFNLDRPNSSTITWLSASQSMTSSPSQSATSTQSISRTPSSSSTPSQTSSSTPPQSKTATQSASSATVVTPCCAVSTSISATQTDTQLTSLSSTLTTASSVSATATTTTADTPARNAMLASATVITAVIAGASSVAAVFVVAIIASLVFYTCHNKRIKRLVHRRARVEAAARGPLQVKSTAFGNPLAVPIADSEILIQLSPIVKAFQQSAHPPV